MLFIWLKFANFESSIYCMKDKSLYFHIASSGVCWWVSRCLAIMNFKYLLVLGGMMLKVKQRIKLCCLGHLLDRRCDLVWLQLNPGGGFRVNLWSLSRPCLTDLYLPQQPMGNGDDIHDNSLALVLFLTGPFSSCLTILWLTTTLSSNSRLMLWFLPSSLFMFLNHRLFFCTCI